MIVILREVKTTLIGHLGASVVSTSRRNLELKLKVLYVRSEWQRYYMQFVGLGRPAILQDLRMGVSGNSFIK